MKTTENELILTIHTYMADVHQWISGTLTKTGSEKRILFATDNKGATYQAELYYTNYKLKTFNEVLNKLLTKRKYTKTVEIPTQFIYEL